MLSLLMKASPWMKRKSVLLVAEYWVMLGGKELTNVCSLSGKNMIGVGNR